MAGTHDRRFAKSSVSKGGSMLGGEVEYADAAYYLKVIFSSLNERYFTNQLEDATITLQDRKGTNGHFSCAKVWFRKNTCESQHEINIATGGMARPIENIVATMLHEMIHLYCHQFQIADTSKNGVYHNRKFKEEAEKRGLLISHHPQYGWTITEPAEELISFVAEQGWTDIGLYYMSAERNGQNGANGSAGTPKKSSTRKYMCPVCGNSVRATKNVNIICGECHVMYELVR